MTDNRLVIVESPAKAKTISKYLGAGYTVLASYGHVRDLPPKDGSVRPDENFAMDWQQGERAGKAISDISRAAKAADEVLLATDPDREGEAIAWHVQEILREKKLDDRPIRRVTFNEITKKAVQDAIARPRALDQDLIDAYLARRGLDYLFGFTLSPVLWRKLPGSKSAGRVQSVALRLICEREAEIERFIPREYWSLIVSLRTPTGDSFTARLHSVDGKKLDKFGVPNGESAQALAARLNGADFTVAQVDKKQSRRNPYAPFTTSTLQQEASRKLGFGATRTMRLAQQLYEGVDIGGETVGLITYMRTDGVQLSGEAIASARALIHADYGAAYLPDSPRIYKSVAKNAQEAHEAIRPTDLARRPDMMARYLDDDQRKLYQLIWQRTLASQMESLVLDQVSADIADRSGNLVLRATGSTIRFDGFLRVYTEDRDEPADSDEESASRLPELDAGQGVKRENVQPGQHFTDPPPRYSEASLVKKLEELGIGRPSTYASTMQVLQDRSYVKLDKKRFVPEDRGVIVSAFLTNFFEHFVEYGFTAGLEDKLDDVSGGRQQWQELLRAFWDDFSAAIGGTTDLKVSDVLNVLDEKLGPHFFPARADGKDPRACPACTTGRVGLKLGKFGAFLGCANYPECKYTRPLAIQTGEGDDAASLSAGPKILGEDPATGLPVTLRVGPYGPYIQLGPKPAGAEIAPTEKPKRKKGEKAPEAEKPKRASLPKGLSPADVDLDKALALLALPREVGVHPETREMIMAGIGRFGPYLRHAGVWKTLPADDDVLSIGINRAVDLLADAKPSRRNAPGKTLGVHPDDGKPVIQKSGRYGPYVQWNKLIANLPKGADAENFTLDAALDALNAKVGKSGKKPSGKKTPREKTPMPAAGAPAKKAKAKPAKSKTAKKTTKAA